jgi:hypothetical protein
MAKPAADVQRGAVEKHPDAAFLSITTVKFLAPLSFP